MRFGGVFLGALVLYGVVYYWIEHRRTAKGPWTVTFTQESSGVPQLIVQQPKLGISNVQIRFLGAGALTNATQSLRFDSPRAVPYAVPFGTCVYEDLTFLPGSVVFQMFGHQIELLPRVLIIDQREDSWMPNSTTILEAATNSGPARH